MPYPQVCTRKRGKRKCCYWISTNWIGLVLRKLFICFDHNSLKVEACVLPHNHLLKDLDHLCVTHTKYFLMSCNYFLAFKFRPAYEILKRRKVTFFSICLTSFYLYDPFLLPKNTFLEASSFIFIVKTHKIALNLNTF